MGKIVTVDYDLLTKNNVGRPKLKEKNINTVVAKLNTSFSNGYSKIKFRIKNNVPMIYFTNRETENVLPEDQYISSISNNECLIPDYGLKGKYLIEPIGYHWFSLTQTNSNENVLIVKE